MDENGLHGQVTHIRQSHAPKKKGFFGTQWDALKYGPRGGGPPAYRWDIRVKDREAQVWAIALRGQELEGGIEIGDRIFVPGLWKRGTLIKCKSLINETAGGIKIRTR